MKSKKRIIAVLCIIMALLMLLGVFSAAWWIARNAENLQFGGMVGELLAGRDENASKNESTDSERDSLEGLETQENFTQELPYEDTTDSVPPDPIGLPTLRFFLGGCESWIISGYYYRKIQEFFEPGNALEWDHRAVIDDYNVNYVEIWGWAALFEDVPLELGYKIDDGQSIYDNTAEFYDAHESSVTAALGMGAVSAIGMRIKIPVEHLTGTHTVKIVVRRPGCNEGSICKFEIQKAEPPYVFMANAQYLADMLENERSAGIESYQYSPGIYPEMGLIHILSDANTDSPFMEICSYNGEVYSTGARYLVIKCQRNSPNTAYVSVSSSIPKNEENLFFTYGEKWNWELIIIDLAQANPISVNGSYDITYLRFSFFDGTADQITATEIAWIATFRTVEDAQRYDADHPYAKG